MGIWILGPCTSARLFWLLLPLGLSAFLTSPILPMPPSLCCGSKREIGVLDRPYQHFKCHTVSETEEGAGQTRLRGERDVFMAEPSSNNAGLLSGAPGFCF